MKERWVEPDLRDQVVAVVSYWHERGFEKKILLRGIELGSSKFYSWLERYGEDIDHNGKIPHDN